MTHISAPIGTWSGPLIGHEGFVPSLPQDSSSYAWIVIATLLIAGCLHLLNTAVKHGKQALFHRVRLGALGGAAIAMAISVVPVTSGDEKVPSTTGLPDLVSGPPIPWWERLARFPDGQTHRVLQFDGYINNIGEGPLELIGNPQEERGVVQRIWDGTEWRDVTEEDGVSIPWVQFEETDGHDHFHFMTAAAYSLWDERKEEMVIESDKTGFCLLDTEVIAQSNHDEYERYYTEDHTTGYCQQYNPEAVHLLMGISPMWADVYDANTQLQWVDISNVQPGRYHLAGEVDIDNQILESNEDNNGLVFTDKPWTISGYIARDATFGLDNQTPDGAIEISLHALRYAMSGEPRYTITTPPKHGRLSVPTGAQFEGSTVYYFPEEGFDGTDTFEFITRDSTTRFPIEPAVGEITIELDGYEKPDSKDLPKSEQGSEKASIAVVNESEFDERTEEQEERYLERFVELALENENDPDEIVDRIKAERAANAEDSWILGVNLYGTADIKLSLKQGEFDSTEAGSKALDAQDLDTDADIYWVGYDLPPGLRLDAETGQIFGVLYESGRFRFQVEAYEKHESGAISEEPIASVNLAVHASIEAEGGLRRMGDVRSTFGDVEVLRLGWPDGDAYEAEGLPPGVSMQPALPMVVGAAEKTGTYNVKLHELIDGEIVKTVEFQWIVETASIPRFPD